MTAEETTHLDKKFAEQSRQHEKLEKMLTSVVVDINQIKRGVYGDPQNQVLGLIDTDKSQHKRIKSLEDSRKKALWAGGAIIGFLELTWHGIQEWFKSKV